MRCFTDMALHSLYAVTVSAAVATRSRADCSSMEDRRGNKRPYQPKHSPSLVIAIDLVWDNSFAHPFPDVATLMDLLYIGRSSAVRTTLQTLAPIQSSTSFSHCLFDLTLFLWPFTFPFSINFTSVWCLFIYVRN